MSRQYCLTRYFKRKSCVEVRGGDGCCCAAVQFNDCAGVEHLLRDVKDVNITSLSQQVTEKIFSLRALQLRLVEAHEYGRFHNFTTAL